MREWVCYNSWRDCHYFEFVSVKDRKNSMVWCKAAKCFCKNNILFTEASDTAAKQSETCENPASINNRIWISELDTAVERHYAHEIREMLLVFTVDPLLSLH